MITDLVKINKIVTCHQEIRKQINKSMGKFSFLTMSSNFLNTYLHVTLFYRDDTKTNYLFANSADFIILAFFNLMMVIILF